MCANQHIKGVCIARHKKTMHHIVKTLQANKFQKFFALANAGTINNNPPNPTILEWLLSCTCNNAPCQHTILKQTPLIPSPSLKIRFIEFICCHDHYHKQLSKTNVTNTTHVGHITTKRMDSKPPHNDHVGSKILQGCHTSALNGKAQKPHIPRNIKNLLIKSRH